MSRPPKVDWRASAGQSPQSPRTYGYVRAAFAVDWLTAAQETAKTNKPRHVAGLLRITALALAARCEGSGQTWPSLALLSEDTGLEPRTVQRVLRALLHLGIISIQRRAHASSIYTLDLDALRRRARVRPEYAESVTEHQPEPATEQHEDSADEEDQI